MTSACFRLKQTIVKAKPDHSLHQQRMDTRNTVLRYTIHVRIRSFNNRRGGIHNLPCGR